MPIENEPTNFDEANQAVMDMFGMGEPQPQEQIPPNGVEPTPDEPPQDISPEPVPAQTEPAPQAEQIPQQPQQPPAPSPEVMLQQAFGEIQALRQQLQQAQSQMQQMSDVQKQNIVDEALKMPELDLTNLAFDDENTLRAKQNDYTQKMAEYMKATMMRELSPALQYAKEGMAEKEKANIIASLSAMPELQGINDMLPQLDNIIASNKLFASANAPLDEKYVMAYLIANGINSRNKKPDEMTPEKFMQYYQSNQELKDLIDRQRLQEINGNQDILPLSASSGAVNAALNIPQKPQTFDEANELIKKSFFG